MRTSEALNQLQAILSEQEYQTESPLTFQCKTVYGTSNLLLQKYGNPDQVNIKYKKNSSNWTNYIIGDLIPLQSNDKISFINLLSTLSKDDQNYYYFNIDTKYGVNLYINGNVDSMVNYNNLTPYCYYNLFGTKSNGIHDTNMGPSLPATALADYCYAYMFAGCSQMLNYYTLPAKILAPYCYSHMFQGCNCLNGCSIKATVLADYCCEYMFVSGPQRYMKTIYLPATNLASYCYSHMFDSCFSQSQPTTVILPATNLASGCYYGMFMDANKLPLINLPATSLVSKCYSYMFYHANFYNNNNCINAKFTSWISDCTDQWLPCYYSSWYDNDLRKLIIPSQLSVIYGSNYISAPYYIPNHLRPLIVDQLRQGQTIFSVYQQGQDIYHTIWYGSTYSCGYSYYILYNNGNFIFTSSLKTLVPSQSNNTLLGTWNGYEISFQY